MKADNKGDFVECGVWKGGSVMVMAMTLKLLNAKRAIWLYDTFEGMAGQSEFDYHVNDKNDMGYNPSIGTINEVKGNILSTGYDDFHFIKGKVEDTIPNEIPKSIALLRLDTDWYESTKHELNHLYPLLIKGGVFIVDDYGSYFGSKKAADEYFGGKVLLSRIDHDSRLSIKA